MIRGILFSLAALVAMTAVARAETMTALNPPWIPMNVTFAQLPVCNAASTGVVYRVTDALLPVLNVAVAGGGAVAVLVRCNGTSFTVGQ